MGARLTTSWFQKHPTPSGSGWDFHWYDRGGRAEGVAQELTRGRIRHPWAALWLDGDRLWWLRSFSATSATEQRDYAGLVVEELVPRGHSSWEVLLLCAGHGAAAPWTQRSGNSAPRDIAPRPPSHSGPARVQAAEAALCPGPVRATAVESALPHAVWALIPWLPDLRQRLGRGLIVAGDGSAPPIGERTMAHYLAAFAAAGVAPADSEAWTLILRLARADGMELPALFAELAELSRAWAQPQALWAYLAERISPQALERADHLAPAPLWKQGIRDAGWLWSRVCNYWGREFLPPQAGSALAGVLARRIAVDHLYRVEHPSGPPPWRYLYRLRREALLPADQLRAMLALAAERGLPAPPMQ